MIMVGELHRQRFALESAITDDPIMVQNDRDIRRRRYQQRSSIGVYPDKPPPRRFESLHENPLFQP
jgi:hypothetical protein